MTDSADSGRRDVLKRGALLGGALVPAALVSRAEASSDTTRGPFDVRDFGGKDDGKAFDTAALQGAIDACHAAGGGTVRIPPGTFLTKPFQILSHVTLHLAASALVLGSPNLEDYAVEGEDASGESERTGLVTARDAERVPTTMESTSRDAATYGSSAATSIPGTTELRSSGPSA